MCRRCQIGEGMGTALICSNSNLEVDNFKLWVEVAQRKTARYLRTFPTAILYSHLPVAVMTVSDRNVKHVKSRRRPYSGARASWVLSWTCLLDTFLDGSWGGVAAKLSALPRRYRYHPLLAFTSYTVLALIKLHRPWIPPPARCLSHQTARSRALGILVQAPLVATPPLCS
jgi:hypothetical protein